MIMKKYTQPAHFLLVICISFFLSGCGVRRDVARVSVVESTVERVEETHDTSRIYVETQIETQIETRVQEETTDHTVIRTTDFAPDGTVVRVREEFRDVRSAVVSVLVGQETYISVTEEITETETTVTEIEEIQVSKTEEISFDADARMIGRMWIVSVVAAVVLFLIVLYMRKKWHR